MRKQSTLKKSLLAFSAASGSIITLYVGFSIGSLLCSPNVSNQTKMSRESIYDRLASTFDEKVTRSEKWIGIDKYRKNVLSNAEGKVLEVACGTGVNMDVYLELFPGNATGDHHLNQSESKHRQLKLILVDQSKEMIHQTKEKSEKLKDKIEKSSVIIEDIRVEDAHNLSAFANDSFDTVIDTFGLCSFDNPHQALAEMKRVLKPDGKLLLLEHGRSSGNWLIHKLLNFYLDKKVPHHECNWGCTWNRDIIKLCEKHFDSIEVKRHLFQTTYEIICTKR